MLKRPLLQILLLSVLCTFFSTVFAQQPMWTIDLLNRDSTRAEKYKERKLGSEKMAEKKFTKVRRFTQNTFTHYNYYFNANNKVNLVVEQAKIAQKDDYTKLLSFYPYSLENTSTQQTELDSVIIKATAGILLHDLRNDWIDNMYLLMGKAYFYKKDFDTALATFQFINYNLFPRKKDEEDSRVVGTRDAAAKSAISIANPEKQNFLQKVMSEPPSRNDALIWMVRTLIEQNEFGESAGLINTLQADPNLPERLHNDLEEVTAYWFFKQDIYDSAANHLEKALSNTDTKQDLARSEFLLAQMFEMTKQFDKAADYYDKVSRHTNSPLLDIHARLNNAKMMKSSNPKELDNSISNLLSMAKKDRYENYRDILYFSAAQIAMQKPDTNTAITYYNKSLKNNETNIPLKNKTFLQLADIAFDRKDYKSSFIHYDSLQSGDTTLTEEQLEKIMDRHTALSKIVTKIDIISREDSLQRIAAMTPADRDAFIKKLVKKLRKERGLKEEYLNTEGGVISFDNNKDQPADLFANESKGEWYFYSSSLKSKGFREFKSKWGARTNVDNWRLKSAVKTPVTNTSPTIPEMIGSFNPDEITPVETVSNDAKKATDNKDMEVLDLSYDGLMANVPLTDEKMTVSNQLLSKNIFELAQLYQNVLEDYGQAIVTYDESLQRFPDSLYNGELYFGLYYCYNKLGNTSKAAHYKSLLTNQFGNSRATQLLANPSAADPSVNNEAATKEYENIYNLFIEGKFEEAINEKNKADSIYGNNYWTPQLLYIESVYHIKQRNDSAATNILDTIIKLYPSTPIGLKATNMKDVLSRREEIENYLANLEITRAKEDETVRIVERSQPVIVDGKLVADTMIAVAEPIVVPVIKDTVVKVVPLPVRTGEYSFDPLREYNVIMILDKVDGTYINETKNAFNRFNNEKRMSGIIITRDALDAEHALLVFASFANAEEALKYYNTVKKAAPDEVSWLPANKYSFLIIDNGNLQILKEKKNLVEYKNILTTPYPGVF